MVRDLNIHIFNSLMPFCSSDHRCTHYYYQIRLCNRSCYAVSFNTRPFSGLIYDDDYVLKRWGLTFYSRVLTWNSLTSWNTTGKKNDEIFRRILSVYAEITRGVHHGHSGNERLRNLRLYINPPAVTILTFCLTINYHTNNYDWRFNCLFC